MRRRSSAAAEAGRIAKACIAAAFVCPALLVASLMLAGCSGRQAKQPVPTIAGNDSVLLFDHHVHVLSPALIERWKTIGVPFSKPDYAYSDIDSILKFDPAGGMFLVSMAYLYSTSGFSDSSERSNVARENDFVAGLARKHPGRLFAFCAVDPLRPYADDELLRCKRDLGMYGLKLHFATSRVDLRDSTHLARVRQLILSASAERMPVMIHLDTHPDVPDGADAGLLIDSVLASAPPTELILAHLGTSGGYSTATRAIVRRFTEALRTRPELKKHTIWFDISTVALTTESEQAAALTPEDFNDLAADLRELGLERVVFGTDYPAFNSVAYMSALEEGLPLTRDELIAIAGNGLPAGFFARTSPGGGTR